MSHQLFMNFNSVPSSNNSASFSFEKPYARIYQVVV